MSLQEACKALDIMRDNGVRTLIFSGGEPLLYEHIWDVLSYASDLGFTMNMMTNGTLLDSDAAEALGSFDIPVWISLDYYSEKAQRAWRRGGSFRNIFRFIESHLREVMNVGIRSTVFWNNIGDIKNIASFCARNNIPYVARPVINCKMNVVWRRPSQVDLRDLYAMFKDYRDRGHDFIFDDPPYYLYKDSSLDDVFVAQESRVCEAHYHRISVDPRGNVFPCPFLHTRSLMYGNLFRDEWSSIVERHELFRENLAYNACGDHCWFMRQPFPESDTRFRLVRGCHGSCIAESYWRYAREHNRRLSIEELTLLPLYDTSCPYYDA